jgi:hypothetical protein
MKTLLIALVLAGALAGCDDYSDVQFAQQCRYYGGVFHARYGASDPWCMNREGQPEGCSLYNWCRSGS